MPTLAENTALTGALAVAVPMWILDLRRLPPAARDAEIRRWAADGVEQIAHKGDILQFKGGKRGDTAKVFNAMARALAALAHASGGVTFAGQHWCVDHQECLDAEAGIRREPVDPNPDTDYDEPAGPTYHGRPVEDLPTNSDLL